MQTCWRLRCDCGVCVCAFVLHHQSHRVPSILSPSFPSSRSWLGQSSETLSGCRYIFRLVYPSITHLQLFRRLPTTSNNLWLAQALAILGKQIPGDEDFAQCTLNELMTLTNPKFIVSHRLLEKQRLGILLVEGGFEVMMSLSS